MTEMRSNWEDKPEQSADGMSTLWWPKTPAERICHLCRGARMHTQAEHDLVYPVDRQLFLDWEREQERRQAMSDEDLIRQLIADGMTEEEAADKFWEYAATGEGLVESLPRP